MAVIIASFAKKDAAQNSNSVTRKAAPTKQIVEKNTNNQVAAVAKAPSAEQPLPKVVLKTAHPNGTRIYQIEKTQVTVTPDGEVFYLPDEI